MSCHFGLLSVLLSLVLGGYLSASSTDVKDLTQSKCRTAGVDLVENQNRLNKFNYTMAESACRALGLQLASKAQVEKAKDYGYETCSYGWVLDKIGVIPRIQNNENCGKNKTGVLTWKVELDKTFAGAYCFNVSDIRINSCKPELMVTQQPTNTPMVVPTSGSTLAPTSLKTETQTAPALTSRPHATEKTSTTLLYTTLLTTVRMPRTTTPRTTTQTTKPQTTTPTTTLQTTTPTTTLQTTMPTTTPWTTTPQTTTPTTTPQTTTPTVEDTEPPKKQENQMAQKNERIVFGGLPTTLLILALVFFIAAVVLAVCYIKKYKTHLLFTKKKKEREFVEAKVFKATSGAENTRDEERPPNGKEADSPQNPTGSSVEAEV